VRERDFNRRRLGRKRTAERELGHWDLAFATEDARRLAEEAVPLIDRALHASWYEREDNEVDAAAAALCRLRRAAAGQARQTTGGDEAVRQALEQADPQAVVWLASRTISYLDEHGFADAASRGFR
jgi:hypothetical protein